MKILVLEFSSAERSVALVQSAEGQPSDQADRCLGTAKESGSKHTRAIHLVQEALRQARLSRQDVDGIALGLGPGSYTGIRMAIALAQGWQLARGIPLFGISSALGLAHQFQRAGGTGRVNVVIDAQRGEFYLAGYEVTHSEVRETEALSIVNRAAVEEKIARGETVVGPEASRWFKQGTDLFPSAALLGELVLRTSRRIAGEDLEPIYLRETTFAKAPPLRPI